MKPTDPQVIDERRRDRQRNVLDHVHDPECPLSDPGGHLLRCLLALGHLADHPCVVFGEAAAAHHGQAGEPHVRLDHFAEANVRSRDPEADFSFGLAGVEHQLARFDATEHRSDLGAGRTAQGPHCFDLARPLVAGEELRQKQWLHRLFLEHDIKRGRPRQRDRFAGQSRCRSRPGWLFCGGGSHLWFLLPRLGAVARARSRRVCSSSRSTAQLKSHCAS